MERFDGHHCSKYSNGKAKSAQSVLEKSLDRRNCSHTKLLFKKKPSTFSQNLNLNYYSEIFVFILGLLWMISGAQTKSLNPEKYATHLSDYNKNKPASNNTAVDNKALLSGNPKAQALQQANSCSDEYQDFCLHGDCLWVEEIQKAYCSCEVSWRGERCEDPLIDLIENEKPEHQSTIIAVATTVSCFVVAALIAIFCICWRRMKSVRRELEMEEVAGTENKEKLISDSANGLPNGTSAEITS